MGKLRLDQLQASLKKRVAPLYLVTGDEALLVQEACDSIRKHAKSQNFSERELYHSDANFSWDMLLQSANSMSLFAEKKIIEIRVPNGKPGDAGSKALISYCEAPSDDNLLLLVFPKIDKRTQNSKWFKRLESVGEVITIWPVTPHQLPGWIAQRMSAAGLSTDSQAVDILCSKVEGNLLAAVQEIEKLKLLTENNIVDVALMTSAVMESARYDVFGLVDKALSGESRAAVKTLQGLKAEGTEPPVILWALAREIRTLSRIKEAMDMGEYFDSVAKKNGIWDNRKGIVKGALNRLDSRSLQTLVRVASSADKTIKGALNNADIWNVLLDITLMLAGTKALSSRSQRLALQE